MSYQIATRFWSTLGRLANICGFERLTIYAYQKAQKVRLEFANSRKHRD